MHRRRGEKNQNNKKSEKNNSAIIFVQLIICMVLFISFLSVRYFMPDNKENIDSVMSAAMKDNITLEDLNEKVIGLTEKSKTLKKIFSGGIMSVFSSNDNENKENAAPKTNDMSDDAADISGKAQDLQGE